MAYSFLDLALEVLQGAKSPLTYQEIWDLSKIKGFADKLKTKGKTPWQSMGAQLYIDVRDNSQSKFIKVGKRPAKFFLKAREGELEIDSNTPGKDELAKCSKKIDFKERDLHPLLAYYAYANPSFSRGKSIYTKTIFHEKSKKCGYNEWVHPDMVGFYIPLEEWRPKVVDFNKIVDNNAIRLYSFELKRTLQKSNYRESFFQAVSNSSWAHEGYLVAAEIQSDDDFLSELERLAASFGIGIIQLDLQDIDSSSILYPAKVKTSLDWETINKLCEQNVDFEKFIEDVKIAFDSKRIYKSEYDQVMKDPAVYIAEHFKIKQASYSEG